MGIGDWGIGGFEDLGIYLGFGFWCLGFRFGAWDLNLGRHLNIG